MPDWFKFGRKPESLGSRFSVKTPLRDAPGDTVVRRVNQLDDAPESAVWSVSLRAHPTHPTGAYAPKTLFRQLT